MQPDAARDPDAPLIEPFLVVALIGSGAAVLKMLFSSSGSREEDEVWKLAARRVQGELDLAPGSWLKPAKRSIRLEARGVPLVVETYEERSGNTRVEYTRASSGALPGASGIRLVVSPRGLLRKLSKGLGIGEIPTGDADFDAAFHVSAAPRGVAAVFLDRAMRAWASCAKPVSTSSRGACSRAASTAVTPRR
jgi:hypothetical protein